MDFSMPRSSVLHYLSEFAQTHVPLVMPSNYLILCRPPPPPPPFLLLSIFPSIRVFSSESALGIRWQIRVVSSAFLRLLMFLLAVLILACDWASLVAQRAKNLPAAQETQVQFLGQEDPLEKGMATHFSILGLENSMDRGDWWATIHGITKSRT